MAVPPTTTIAPPPTSAQPPVEASSIPRPDAAQAQALYEGLLQIGPGFAVKTRDTLISRARDECTSILGGLTEERIVSNAIARFTTPDIEAVSRRQATEIVDLIRSGGWCR